jgi:hypothetical protein
MDAEQKKAFVARAQPGLFAYDDATNMVRVLDDASRRLVNMDELLMVGQQSTKDPKDDENVVSVSIMPGRFWFRVEVRGWNAAVLGTVRVLLLSRVV